MKVNCFQIDNDLKLTPCEYESAIGSIKNSDSRSWIDLQDFEINELENILDQLSVTGLVRRLCLESLDHPGFYPLKTMVLIIVPVHTNLEVSNETEFLSLLCSHDFLLTFRKKEITHMKNSIDINDSAAWLPDSSIAGLVSSIMISLSLHSLRKASRLKEMILVLEGQVDMEPDSLTVKDISAMRTELLTLQSIVHGQLPAIEALLSTDKAFVNSENIKEYLIWALANFKSTNRTLEWLERRIDVMRSMVEAHAQDKTNSRLGRLTILSTIFMPITFLAGIWGMNFTYMPGLTVNYGYAVAISIMLLIAGFMYYYFKKRGWFE